MHIQESGFGVAEETSLLANMARRFLNGRDQKCDFQSRWSAFAEMGWLALPIVEAFGGVGADDDVLAALARELGRASAREPFVAVIAGAAALLAECGGDAAERMLARIADGSAIVGFTKQQLDAAASAGEWVVNGNARLVIGADVANALVVAGRCAGEEERLFAIDLDSPTVSRRVVATLAGPGAADLRFSDTPAVLLRSTETTTLIARALDRAAAISCHEAIGAIDLLTETTIAYVSGREQFGQPLASFQVIQHAVADLVVWQDEARAAGRLALLGLATSGAARERAISGAKVRVGTMGMAIAHQAIQLHGAMGVTEELNVGQSARQLLAFTAQWGTSDEHLERYAWQAAKMPLGYLAGSHAGGDTLLKLDDEATALQSEVRAFLETALPPPFSRAQRLTPTVYPEADVAGAWQEILDRHGWAAPNWPAEYGGSGWTPVQRYIWAHESAAAHAPIISPLGLQLVGPVLMRFGTPEQKTRFLPGIVSGKSVWCQGFSEPGAGSDLAALATRAVRTADGDYRVNGSKMWTTHAHLADFMAALVRTGPVNGRREGISFLLIDMKSPGITIRPIRTIGGDHEVNQVFFDDVSVPADNLVKSEGEGWAIAGAMLAQERGGDIMSAGHRALLADIRAAALADPARNADPFWRAFAEVAIAVDTLEMLEFHHATVAAGERTAGAASILKLRASELQQAVTELGVRAVGRDALRWFAERPIDADPAATPKDAFVARYLNSRANTIFGGSREIQKGLIARTVLPK